MKIRNKFLWDTQRDTLENVQNHILKESKGSTPSSAETFEITSRNIFGEKFSYKLKASPFRDTHFCNINRSYVM
jgi:hypothetical protein